jgi:hypothetical protein
MYNRKVVSRLFLVAVFLVTLAGFNIIKAAEVNASSNFRVIGYITWANLDDKWEAGKTLDSEPSLKYCTHIIGPAVITTSTSNPVIKAEYGSLSIFTEIAEAAHARGIKALAYVYGLTTDLATIIKNGKLNVLATSIRNLVINYGLDGVELDFESLNTVDQKSTGALIDALYTLLQPSGKIISTVGMAGKSSPDLTVAEAAKVEWIDVMCYDMSVGGYKHATYTDTVNVMNKWLGKTSNTNFGFPASKLIMGIPFYGYNSDKSQQYDYDTIVDTLNPTADQDTGIISGKSVWWSGINTTKSKVSWAVENNLGGIMAFAIGYDKLNNNRSLLLNAYNKINNTSTVPSTTTTTTTPTTTTTTTTSQSSFGYQSTGANNNGAVNYMFFGSGTPSSSSKAKSITVYVGSYKSGAKVKCALYNASTLALVGTTEEKTITATGTLTLNFASQPSVVAGTKYLIVWWNGGASFQGRYNSGASSTTGGYKAVTYGTWPSKLESINYQPAYYSLYCTLN